MTVLANENLSVRISEAVHETNVINFVSAIFEAKPTEAKEGLKIHKEKENCLFCRGTDNNTW